MSECTPPTYRAAPSGAQRASQVDLFDRRRRKRAPRARTPEHAEQVALVKWARLSERQHPELALLHAIPNGGHRFVAVAKAMKAEGVKSGVPDLCLPVARGRWHGLYVELKARDGRASESQRWWLARLIEQGYRAELAHGWEAARDVILDYLTEDQCQISQA